MRLRVVERPIRAVQGRAKDVHVLMWGVSAAFTLYFLVPLLQNVRLYDTRIQTLEARDPERFLTAENRNVLVDSFVKWRIVDVRQFYVSVAQRGDPTMAAESRISQTVNDALRAEFARRILGNGPRRRLVREGVGELVRAPHEHQQAEAHTQRTQRTPDVGAPHGWDQVDAVVEDVGGRELGGRGDLAQLLVHVLQLVHGGLLQHVLASAELYNPATGRWTGRGREVPHAADLRDRTAFAAGHLAGSRSFELSTNFVTYLGWLLPWVFWWCGSCSCLKPSGSG